MENMWVTKEVEEWYVPEETASAKAQGWALSHYVERWQGKCHQLQLPLFTQIHKRVNTEGSMYMLQGSEAQSIVGRSAPTLH